MPRFLWAVTLFALIFPITTASAKVYKCPKEGGGYTLQDIPCVGMPSDEAPTKSSPVPAPDVASPHETGTNWDKMCQSVGEAVEAMTAARDRGVPMSETLAKGLPGFRAAGESAETLYRSIVLQIYEKTWWTPAIARQRIETQCYKAQTLRQNQ